MELRDRLVLVTGGSGFLGKHFLQVLEKTGAKVIAPTRSQLDLLCPAEILPYLYKKKPEAVIHLAARVGGIGANQKEPGKFFTENMRMGLDLIDACKLYQQAGRNILQKFVMVGTTCSYPCEIPLPFKETDLWNGYPEPTNAPYGIAKKALGVMLEAYREQYGFPSVTLILANLYGPGDHDDLEKSHVIPALIRKILEAKIRNTPLEVWGSGMPTREFLYAPDAAEGIMAALKNYDGKSGPINLGGKGEISIRGLVTMLCEILEFKGQTIYDGSKPDGQPRRALNSEKALVHLGWQAKTFLHDGLRKTVEAMLEKTH